MLHAWKLAFRHPTSGEEKSFEAPVPPDFSPVMEQIPAA
jgi:23S rRNA pseudouridine1911/1915/1917 synthase